MLPRRATASMGIGHKDRSKSATHVWIVATFVCDDDHMRALLVPLALFVYVTMDITMNHGASLQGWISLFSAIAHSTGLA
jgi:hypothetical protein